MKKIVKLNGGLGNQMFQYAFACALAKKHGFEIVFDFSYFEEKPADKNVVIRPFELNIFNIECNSASEEDLNKIIRSNNNSAFEKFLWNLFNINKYKPKKNIVLQKSAYKFDKKLLNSKDVYYYDGYFQNEKYFKDARKELLKKFTLKTPLDEKNQLILNKILETDPISIHVRRGDYIKLESANKHHGTCSLDYYKKAVEYISRRIKSPHFFLFSDDIEWVIKNLKIEYPFTVVDFNHDKGWLDMNLMKNCKHNIIANSSFSWWAAWLNENPDKIVIAPKKWALKNQKCDIVPKIWLKL